MLLWIRNVDSWQQVDAKECARLLQELDAGQAVALTLCGERNAQTYSGQGGGWLRKLGAAMGGKKAAAALAAL